jgi:hypothetical protein
MSKLQELKQLITELHAAGEDERLDVEQYVELCMAKLEIAYELAQHIPDSLSVNPPSAEEAAAVDAAMADLLVRGQAKVDQLLAHGHVDVEKLMLHGVGEIGRITENGATLLDELRSKGYPVGGKDHGK